MGIYFFIFRCFLAFLHTDWTCFDFRCFWSFVNDWLDILNIVFMFWKSILLPIVNQPEFIWFRLSRSRVTPIRGRSVTIMLITSLERRLNPRGISSSALVILETLLSKSFRIQICLFIARNLRDTWSLYLIVTFAISSKTLLISLKKLFIVIINNTNIILRRPHSLIHYDRIISDLAGKFGWSTGQRFRI